MAIVSRLKRRGWDLLRLNYFLYPGIRDYRAPVFLHPWYEHRRRRLGPMGIAANALVYAGFCAWLPLRARQVAARWEKSGEWRAFAQRTGRQWMTDPEDLATFDIESEEALHHYQRRMEQVPVVRAIENKWTDHNPLLIDKSRFMQHCRVHGFPVPRLFAIVRDGSVEAFEPVDAAGVLAILKPARGSGGRGIRLVELSGEGALQRLARTLGSGEWLVQERLQVHNSLSDLALDALPTLRLTTLLNERGNPEIVSAALRFASRGGVAIDNGHAGGLMAPVDLETGRLGEGKSGWHPGRYPAHPQTGAPIAGRPVPEWPEARDLVLRAHSELFAAHVLIGWDVGVSSRGPVLIEANQRPAVRLTQRAAGKGIGQMRYGELLAFHLRRAVSERPEARPRFLGRG